MDYGFQRRLGLFSPLAGAPCIVDPQEGGGTAVLSRPRQENTELRIVRTFGDDARQVMVIDDEESILRVTSIMLRKLGLLPRPILSGVEGFDVLSESSDQFGVVFLDIMLADSSGLDVYEWIRAGDLDMPVIFSSGFAQADLLQATLRGDDRTRFLPKPFGMSELRRVLSELSS